MKKRLSWCGNDIGNTFCLLIHPSPFYSCITKPLATSDGHTYRISLVVIKGWKWNLAYSTIQCSRTVCHPIYNVFLLFSYILLKRVVCSQLIFYKHLSLWHVERRTLLISFRYIFLFIHLSFNNNKHFRQIWWYLKSCRAILNPV